MTVDEKGATSAAREFDKALAANKDLPILAGIIAGSLVFPLFKTIIETFDGSLPFFARTRHNYRDLSL